MKVVDKQITQSFPKASQTDKSANLLNKQAINTNDGKEQNRELAQSLVQPANNIVKANGLHSTENKTTQTQAKPDTGFNFLQFFTGASENLGHSPKSLARNFYNNISRVNFI